jgi:hypothetical protein
MTATYLGYQVLHLPDQAQDLAQWLKVHAGQPLSVWGKTVAGSGCNYGINPEEMPWGDASIKSFAATAGRCEFTTQAESFVIEVSEFPRDRWGNTATYSEISLQEGYFLVGYEDDALTDYKISLDEGGEKEFIEWLFENQPELVSEISEETVAGGFSNSWRYITTNQPFGSAEWQAAIAAYENAD